jgi:pSer/pThr/pTyr-binding forkhead associated (FHA) protein
MDLFEKINRSFGQWYEGLFGGSDDVRPKDILRRILAAMEDNRKEGFDSKIYVPNQYILEINVQDEEEKEYLLSFLNKDELEAAVRKYCQQNQYHIRGALDFTVREADADSDSADADKKPEKVRVRCRYDTRVTAPPARYAPEPPEDRTVAKVSMHNPDEEGTVAAVASASLVVYAPDRSPFRYSISRGSVLIGRSASSGCDLVIASDGQISKKHAKIELDPDGKFTLYDLNSTNGTKINGRRVENRSLNDGDEIHIGETRITFQRSASESYVPASGGPVTRPEPRLAASRGMYGGAAMRNFEEPGSSSPPLRLLHTRSARLVLMDAEQDVDDYLLASETTLGRAVTNDIVLPERSVAARHARICSDGDGYTLEPLAPGHIVAVNGVPLAAGESSVLRDRDRITLGTLTLRFESGDPSL